MSIPDPWRCCGCSLRVMWGSLPSSASPSTSRWCRSPPSANSTTSTFQSRSRRRCRGAGNGSALAHSASNTTRRYSTACRWRLPMWSKSPHRRRRSPAANWPRPFASSSRPPRPTWRGSSPSTTRSIFNRSSSSPSISGSNLPRRLRPSRSQPVATSIRSALPVLPRSKAMSTSVPCSGMHSMTHGSPSARRRRSSPTHRSGSRSAHMCRRPRARTPAATRLLWRPIRTRRCGWRTQVAHIKGAGRGVRSPFGSTTRWMLRRSMRPTSP